MLCKLYLNKAINFLTDEKVVFSNSIGIEDEKTCQIPITLQLIVGWPWASYLTNTSTHQFSHL